MKYFYKYNIGSIVMLMMASYLAYYLLLDNNWLHTSIASIINTTQDLPFESHLLIVGLIPIYVGVIVFGAGLLGIYWGNRLQHYIVKRHKKLKN